MTRCPSAETLAGLGVAITEGPAFEELDRHIESCAACRSALDALARDEAGWTGAGAHGPSDRLDPPEIPGFAIEEELGRGTMGVVYRAWQARLASRVALKVLRGAALDGGRVSEDWLREAHAGARVRDPRVVQIHDVGEASGFRYLVLEYVPSGSLKDRLDGPLSAAASTAIAEQIARGVAAIHRAGILHLDLKPPNILLDSEPGSAWESIALKVADFGIARDTDEAGRVCATMRGPWGTPFYMAPELVDADRLKTGPASDVYSLARSSTSY
jgi:serine/threonine-protein kinase